VYRFLLLDGELLDVVRRRPPTVVGDGRSSVDELIAAENSRRLEADGEEGLWLLRADLDLVLALERQGLRPSAVPDAGRRVAVKSVTNQNRAEDNETVREEISEELVAEARHAAELVGLRLAGVDLVTTDLTRPLVESGGVILEVNCTPGLHHHLLVADRAGATDVATPILRKLLGDD
jgi:cyanophycin synthetase